MKMLLKVIQQKKIANRDVGTKRTNKKGGRASFVEILFHEHLQKDFFQRVKITFTAKQKATFKREFDKTLRQ